MSEFKLEGNLKNMIKNQPFLIQDPRKEEPVTPCMDVYMTKIKSDGILDKLKFMIVVRGDFQNKEIIGDTCYSTASTSTLEYLPAYTSKQNSRVHQFYFIGSFLKVNVKHGIFAKLYNRYG